MIYKPVLNLKSCVKTKGSTLVPDYQSTASTHQHFVIRDGVRADAISQEGHSVGVVGRVHSIDTAHVKAILGLTDARCHLLDRERHRLSYSTENAGWPNIVLVALKGQV